MTTQKEIDEAANNWNKTKDPYYKDLWYKLVKEFGNGPNSIKRRVISINPSVTKQMMEGIKLLNEVSCFDLCDMLRLKLSGYVDTLNLHIMNDGSVLIGCMCR
jgi:hypothetical protein